MAFPTFLARMIIFLSLSNLLLSSTPIGATFFPNVPIPKSNLVHDVCKKTSVYNFCVGALESNYRVSGSESDVLSFSKSTLKLAIHTAENTRAHIYKLLKSYKTDLRLRTSLKTCADCYGNVIGSFKSAYGELQTDALTANYDAQVAGDGVDGCEKAMSSNGVQVRSVSARNKVMKNFVSIGFSVTDYFSKSTDLSIRML